MSKVKSFSLDEGSLEAISRMKDEGVSASSFVREALKNFSISSKEPVLSSKLKSEAVESSLSKFDFSNNLIESKEFTFDFTIEGLPIGSVGLITGEGGLGKSMLAMMIGLDFCISSYLSKCPVSSRGKVSYLSFEESGEILSNRLIHFSENYLLNKKSIIDRFNLYDLTDSYFDIESDESQGFLSEILLSSELVILDTFSDIHSLDENKASDMNKVMKNLTLLASRYKSSILILHHSSKPQNGLLGRNQHSIRGSSVIVNKSKFQVRLSRLDKSDLKSRELKIPGFSGRLDDYVYADYGGNYRSSFNVVYKRGVKGILEPVFSSTKEEGEKSANKEIEPLDKEYIGELEMEGEDLSVSKDHPYYYEYLKDKIYRQKLAKSLGKRIDDLDFFDFPGDYQAPFIHGEHISEHERSNSSEPSPFINSMLSSSEDRDE